MRRSFRVILAVLVVSVLGLVSASSALARSGPDLVVSALAEPPDGVAHGGTFQVSYTVANEGNRRASKRTRTEFYLTKKQRNPRRGDFKLRGNSRKKRINRLRAFNDLARRIKLRLSTRIPDGLYYLVACADRTKRLKEAEETNNCRITGQVVAVGSAVTGPDVVGGGGAGGNQATVGRTSLPVGQPTIEGPLTSPGDNEKSNQRKTLFNVGPVSVVLDCKKTSNGDNSPPEDAFTNPGSFDEDGTEGKLLVYTSSGTETFSSLGASSRRNIPPGQGSPATANDPNGAGAVAAENHGGEGKHMALAVARDPEQAAPERDWVTAFKAADIYVAHSSGTEFSFHGYVGIGVLGVGNRCVSGGVVTIIHK
jgi:hypothetical protein